MQCIRPGIQRMPAHNANHHESIHNIDLSLGALLPPQAPPPPTSPASDRAARPQRGGGPGPAAQEPRAEPAQNWATSGYQRNRAFDNVLLRRDGANRGAPQGGQMAREEQKGTFQAITHAQWPGSREGRLFGRGSRAPRQGRKLAGLKAPSPACQAQLLALAPEESATTGAPTGAEQRR